MTAQTESKKKYSLPKSKGANFYYSAPVQAIFEEVKNAAIEIWNTYDNSFGYADEKRHKVERLPNVADNFMYIVAMFDYGNQELLASKVSKMARDAIFERLFSGGAAVPEIPYSLVPAKYRWLWLH